MMNGAAVRGTMDAEADRSDAAECGAMFWSLTRLHLFPFNGFIKAACHIQIQTNGFTCVTSYK